MENEKSTSSKLALLRKARNLTYSDLAVYLNVSPKTVEKYETGEVEMDNVTMSSLAEYFEVPVTFFAKEKVKREEKTETLGGKIVKLRKERGLTQADLGMLLNISSQAVSKWERDESCPDFETLSKLAQFFSVSVTYFENKKEEEPKKETNNDELVGVCHDCGKAIRSGEEYEMIPQLVCKDCVERKKRLQRQKQEEEKRAAAKKREAERVQALRRQEEIVRSRNRGLIWSAVIVGVLWIISLITSISNHVDAGTIVWTSIVGVLFLYTYVAQLFWDGAVVACTLAGGKIIGTPGVIFSLDLDGLVFLIAVKILFAILRLLVFLITVAACAFAAILISPLTFFFALHRVNEGDLVD